MTFDGKKVERIELCGDAVMRPTHEISVHYSALIRHLEQFLRARLDVPLDAYLDKSGQMVCDDRDRRHGSISTVVLNAQPNPDQLTFFRLRAELDALRLRFIDEDKKRRA